MRKIIWYALLAMFMMVSFLSSCNKTADVSNTSPQASDSKSSGDSTDSITSTESDTSSTITDTTGSTTSSAAGSFVRTSSKPTSSTPASSKSDTNKPVVLNVKDFGAKGDGKTDDALAIFRAVSALRSSPPGSVLNFEANKTYYYKNNGSIIKSVFYLENDTGYTLKGNNCLIKLGGYDKNYMNIRNCKDIVIEGFNFDYAEYKPAFAATIDSYDLSSGTAILTADRPIHLETGDTYTSTTQDYFGTIPSSNSRYYMWIKKYEMIDANARKVKVYFDTSKGHASLILSSPNLKKDGLVMPMPQISFNGISCEIHDNTNITLRKINVYSSRYHGFYCMRNKGTVLFEDVNIKRAPYDQNLKYLSWGDVWHMTNNRAKIILKNCKAEMYIYDDVFNFHTSTMYVAEKHSNTEITLQANNKYYGVPEILPGDTITIIDVNSGALVGRPTVKKVVEQKEQSVRVILNISMPSLKAGSKIYAWDEEANGHPDSELINCDMNGTYRVRANVTFTNCKLYIRRFWIGLEVIGSEGSVPRNVLFKNCELPGDDGKVWEIRSMNTVKNGYRVENIVFENCSGINMDKVLKDPYDEVIIR